MTCPHSTPASEKATVCDLLSAIRGGESKVSVLKVCQPCQREWVDDTPPTCDNLTPTLIRIMPSRGLGDTAAKITHATGIAAAVHAVSRVTGVPCGCAERQRRWNERFPSKTPETQ